VHRPGAPHAGRAVGKVVNDDRADWREAWALFPGSVAYIWHAGTKANAAFALSKFGPTSAFLVTFRRST
jgi:hypothetical protein